MIRAQTARAIKPTAPTCDEDLDDDFAWDESNSETLAAIAEAEELLKSGTAKRYNTAEEMLDDIFEGDSWRQ